LLINTPLGKSSMEDDGVLRKAALMAQIPYTTTMPAARAAVAAIKALKSGQVEVKPLQEHYKTILG
jgi:carbamoyl-phosphate synthase large subunit